MAGNGTAQFCQWSEGRSEWEQPKLFRGIFPLSCHLLPGPRSPQRLLNWMLALACQRGHLGLVKLLVLTHGADPESYAVRKNEFPVIVRLPLYAAIKSGGSPCQSRPWEPSKVGDVGPCLRPHLWLLNSSTCVETFANSIICLSFKMSAPSVIGPTRTCKGISVTGTSCGQWDHSSHFTGQSATKSPPQTGICHLKGGHREGRPAQLPFSFPFHLLASAILDNGDTLYV